MKRRRRRNAGTRRSNPATMPVLLANPRRRARRARRGWFSFGKVRSMIAGMMQKRGKTRRRRRTIKANPQHFRPTRRAHFRRRRSNPTGPINFAVMVRIGVAGGAGIVVARVAGFLYTKHLAPMVLGDSGKADPNSMRAWINDAVRIAVQEITILALARAARGARLGSDMDHKAFTIGGTAEVARGALGTIVGHLSPTTTRGAWGLDAPPPGYMMQDGTVWILDQTTGRYVLAAGDEDPEDFAGLEDEDAFSGLEDEDAFSG